ncbi:hypothetical protein BCR36DRAFT_404595 [Piromyces finnis]|uniref:Uncharacterized protein n=1 Tax=Piromyces finnis TaxID=1754191 RepID=A0A1Y1V8Z5_9FUNG|nr:hypothetical protein BCR36DRAFT_404595 [Piromyces finnis]|eukprot:ORX50057.1 hypothetical protein BCR36DRAFT_404595 [Piromyces finnis]
MQNPTNHNTKVNDNKNKKNDGGNGKGKGSNPKKDNKINNKENISSNSERRNSKHTNIPKNKFNKDDHNNNTTNKNNKSNHNSKGGKSGSEDHNRKGNNLSRKKSKQNFDLNKKNSFSNSHDKKSNRKNSGGSNILKVPQPTETFDKSVESICVSKLPSYINGQMVDNGIDKFVNLAKLSLADHGKVKLIGVEPALALMTSIILILEEQKVIRKPVILTRTMEDKNKNLKSGIITELYPSTNKVISKLSK